MKGVSDEVLRRGMNGCGFFLCGCKVRGFSFSDVAPRVEIEIFGGH